MTVCVSVDAYVSNQGIKSFSFLPWPDLYGQSVHSHVIAHVCKCLRVWYCKAASRPGCVLDVIDRRWKLNFQPIACTAASPETKSLCCKIMRFCLVIKPHVHGKWLTGQKDFRLMFCSDLIGVISAVILTTFKMYELSTGNLSEVKYCLLAFYWRKTNQTCFLWRSHSVRLCLCISVWNHLIVQMVDVTS